MDKKEADCRTQTKQWPQNLNKTGFEAERQIFEGMKAGLLPAERGRTKDSSPSSRRKLPCLDEVSGGRKG